MKQQTYYACGFDKMIIALYLVKDGARPNCHQVSLQAQLLITICLLTGVQVNNWVDPIQESSAIWADLANKKNPIIGSQRQSEICCIEYT